MAQKSACLFLGVGWVGNITLFKANSLQNKTKNKIELFLQNQKFCTSASLKQYKHGIYRQKYVNTLANVAIEETRSKWGNQNEMFWLAINETIWHYHSEMRKSKDNCFSFSYFKFWYISKHFYKEKTTPLVLSVRSALLKASHNNALWGKSLHSSAPEHFSGSCCLPWILSLLCSSKSSLLICLKSEKDPTQLKSSAYHGLRSVSYILI